jgi:hypothetical protein
MRSLEGGTVRRTLAVVVALLLCFMFVTACGVHITSGSAKHSKAAPAAPAQPGTFTAHGTVLLLYRRGTGQSGECGGETGYHGIGPGTQITVKDESGELVAVGELGTDTRIKQRFFCKFRFRVPNVPSNLASYVVEVAHRGAFTYSRAQLQREIGLTLS